MMIRFEFVVVDDQFLENIIKSKTTISICTQNDDGCYYIINQHD